MKDHITLLLDTNILIPLEDSGQTLSSDLAEVKRLCDELNYKILIHPKQQEDLDQDKDEKRKEVVTSRVAQYREIPNPPLLTDEEIEKHNWREINRNDKIDNLLLAALVRDSVHYLISEDKGIHRKAKKSNIGERVLRIPQLLKLLRRESNQAFEAPVGIEDRYSYEFDVDNPFFDSLRKAYPKFNKWWADKCCKEHRKMWCVHENFTPLAICVYNIEESSKITVEKPELNGKHLKICTFKVGQEIRGQRIGERLLHTAFTHAALLKIPWVYLHADAEKHIQLIDLCEDYGFEKHGTYNGDIVYLKSMLPRKDSYDLDPIDFATKYHPHFIDDDRVNKFIVPIKPTYHERLFPDISDTHDGALPGLFPIGYAGNTIKKAYICHSRIKKMQAGDIVLFYRSKDRKSIEVIGVVEKAQHVDKLFALNHLVAKRTVYTNSELEDLINKPCIVVLFRTMQTNLKIDMKMLKENDISPPQSICEINHKKYSNITK